MDQIGREPAPSELKLLADPKGEVQVLAGWLMTHATVPFNRRRRQLCRATARSAMVRNRPDTLAPRIVNAAG
jgi:hypothetical protein